MKSRGEEAALRFTAERLRGRVMNWLMNTQRFCGEATNKNKHSRCWPADFGKSSSSSTAQNSTIDLILHIY